jgi:hypothetical protein
MDSDKRQARRGVRKKRKKGESARTQEAGHHLHLAQNSQESPAVTAHSSCARDIEGVYRYR